MDGTTYKVYVPREKRDLFDLIMEFIEAKSQYDYYKKELLKKLDVKP